ncbi:potassium-transporting ATPase subunit KdpC [Kosakonia sp. S42]|uniref:potassium-transporting ATPase subunit KdpC n=1 Tax=Kosakonia sp. S42 TaxID=2767458 RepID=UPI0019090767|nr:potassium-transporting ATPase subunit KdpC [Kosakonia sp. S42]
MATSALSGIARPVVVSAILFMIATGILYPLATTGVARILFPNQSQGSLIKQNGKPIGSRVIGQYFTEPQYFHGRPSVTSGTDPNDTSRTMDDPYNASASAASNQGAISKKLLEAVAERAAAYRKDNGLAPDAKVPVDAVTASASGLDPDISILNAQLQAPRVAKARGIAESSVLAMVERSTKGRQLGVLGESRVNVLELNLALDKAAPARQAMK